MWFFSRRLTLQVCLVAVLLAGYSAFAQQMSVATLVDFIKSSVKQKNSDKETASYLAKVKLNEKLTPSIVEELQDVGAGPKTLAALEALVTQTANLAPPPVKTVSVAPARAVGPPEPPAAEQKKVLEETREWALSYTKSLPDFLCLEVTNRSVDPHYKPDGEGSWSPEDRLIEKLTFFDHKENYELFQHNETAVVGKAAETLGGSLSRGEWASLLGEIFEPSTKTEFRWLKWATVRGKLAHAFQYRVEQEFSQESISHGGQEKIIAGYHGIVYVQKGPNVVLRVTIIPDIPADFPVQDINQVVDYDYQVIGTSEYLLPLKSQVTMRDGRMGSRNDIQWRSYRRYSADAVITFDDAPVSDSKPDVTDAPKQ
jgi:hypothetical protein